jgi:hypothetical protein
MCLFPPSGHRCRVQVRAGGSVARLCGSEALAARDLKEGRQTTHPELVLFRGWGTVQQHAAHDPAGRDLQPLVDLVDRTAPRPILAAVNQLTELLQRCRSGVRTALAIDVMRLGLDRSRRKIRHDFGRAMLRLADARAAAWTRLRVFSVGVSSCRGLCSMPVARGRRPGRRGWPGWGRLGVRGCGGCGWRSGRGPGPAGRVRVTAAGLLGR